MAMMTQAKEAIAEKQGEIENVVSNKRDVMIEKAQGLIPNQGTEGHLTKKIESQTSRIPSIGFLGLALGSMIVSAGFTLFSRKKEYGNFVGLWAPSFLLLGIYNKLVKVEGSEQKS